MLKTSMSSGASENEVDAVHAKPAAIKELIRTAIESAASIADPPDNTFPVAMEATRRMG